MDRKKLLLLLGALVIAIGTAMMARSMFAGASAPQAEAVVPVPEGPKVLVAQRALPIGTIITADAVSYQTWPKEMVQDAYFIDGESDITHETASTGGAIDSSHRVLGPYSGSHHSGLSSPYAAATFRNVSWVGSV